MAFKEKPDRAGVLVGPLSLREQLQATDHDWRFTDAEMITAAAYSTLSIGMHAKR